MTDYKLSELSIIGDFAAEKGVNPQTLKNAVEKLEIKYVQKIGASHLYLKADLITALGTTSQAHKVGYVHPDKFKEIQDLHQAAVVRSLELETGLDYANSEIARLQAELETVTAERDAAYSAALSA